jgi:squalene cyclase
MSAKTEEIGGLLGDDHLIKTAIGDIEKHVHLDWEQISAYKWPMFQKGSPGAPNYNVIQAQSHDGKWIPRWIVVDGDGTCLRMFELTEPITAQDVAKAAYDIIRELHGISYEQTGVKGIIQRIEVGPESPPRY